MAAEFRRHRKKIQDLDLLNLWNCRGFIIQTLSEYDQVVEWCKKFIDSKKEKVLLGLIIPCEVGQTSALYKSIIEALKIPTRITMHIVYFNIPHKKISNIAPYWDLEEYNNEVFLVKNHI